VLYSSNISVREIVLLSYQVCAHIRVLHPGLEVADGVAKIIHHYINLWQHCLKLGLQSRQD